MLQVARRVKKRNHLNHSREFDINPKLPLWGKLLLMYHYALGVPRSGTLKIEVCHHLLMGTEGVTYSSDATKIRK
jgi:hypothetical protein